MKTQTNLQSWQLANGDWLVMFPRKLNANHVILIRALLHSAKEVYTSENDSTVIILDKDV